jgi:hypothetical protein
VQSGSDRAAAVEHHCTALAAKRAYDKAAIGPGDVDVAEVHDATAMGEIIQVENLGFCAYGDGGALAERGETRIGGRLPVYPSGGLESKGHPIGATGLGQIHELVTQLRGEAGPRQVANARIAIAENGGGVIGIEEAVAHPILERHGLIVDPAVGRPRDRRGLRARGPKRPSQRVRGVRARAGCGEAREIEGPRVTGVGQCVRDEAGVRVR